MMRFQTSVRLIAQAGLLLAASLAGSACAPHDLLGPEGAQPATIALTINGSASLASFGDTAVVRSRVLDDAGNVVSNAALHWTVAPAGILERDSDGIYRAIGNGRVTITAEIDIGETGVRPQGYWAGKIADSVIVEVRQRAVRLAFVPADTAFKTLGASRQLRVVATDARGHNVPDALRTLSWASANPLAIAVDTAGVVRSLAEGVSRVTVQTEGFSSAITFTVAPNLPHASCMVYAQRGQSKQSCVTLNFTLHEREAAR